MNFGRVQFARNILLNLRANFSNSRLSNSHSRSNKRKTLPPLPQNPMSQIEMQKTLQKAKRDKRAKLEKYVPATVTLQILGSGSPGTPGSLYVSTDHSKYLFNCGEGSQRLAHEHHLRLGKLDHVFFTTPTWRNMGGLPGMALTIQDCGVQKIQLHGPKGISDIFDAVKRFVLLTDLVVTEENCDENQTYEDNVMSVRYVQLTNNVPESDSELDDSFLTDDTDYYAHEFNRNGKRDVKFQRPAQKLQKIYHDRTLKNKVRGCFAYICKLHPKPGYLDLAKCVERGITPGPILGELKAGKDVTLPDGKIIKSSEVCAPPTPGPVFIVLEVPDKDYLNSLVENDIFKQYQAEGENEEDRANSIVHFTPDNVLENPMYQEWMKKFPKNTEHIIINESNDCYNYEAIHRIQHKLNLLHSEIFPMIHDKTCMEEENHEDDSVGGLKVHRAKTRNAIHLRPLEGLDKSSVVKIDRKEDIDEVFNTDGFLDALAELQTDINAKSKELKDLPKFPKLLVLGTGSCIPNKVRNTSGLLLRIDEETSILLDCGEGTVGQIIRFFGASKVDKVLASIKGIYVSHLHADHHLGLIGVLQERQKVTDKPVLLFAPRQIDSWLRLYDRKFESIEKTFNLVPNQCIMANSRKTTPRVDEEMQTSLKITEISTVEVNHCLHAYGVSIVLNNGQKVVYSGDTKPCTSLVDLGQGCDLLIHEATMEDGLEDEARKKMHSTISQAIKIGEEMNSKFVLLTHFSQRYSKMPRLPDKSTGLNLNNVGIAFDNMQVSFSELPLLPLFYPSLHLIFSEFCMILEEKAQKRLMREKERIGSL